MFALTGKEFRTFAHPPAQMRDVLVDHGLRPSMTQADRVWHVQGLTR